MKRAALPDRARRPSKPARAWPSSLSATRATPESDVNAAVPARADRAAGHRVRLSDHKDEAD